MAKVYLSNLNTKLGNIYPAADVVDIFYPKDDFGEKTNRLAHALSKRIGVANRSSVMNMHEFHKRELYSEEFHPANWGVSLFNECVPDNLKEHIGLINVCYNSSAHDNSLPSISAQIVHKLNLENYILPLDSTFLGCAAGVIEIERAVDFVEKNNKAAFVFVYDHCMNMASFTKDPKDPHYKNDLKTSLLFSDGGAGFLILPESLIDKTYKPNLEIVKIKTKFISSMNIHVENKRFVLGDSVDLEVPQAVSKETIKPILEKYKLSVNDIKHWCFHLGSRSIIEGFCKDNSLDISKDLVKPSIETFLKFGNFSSPSCFFVLEHVMKSSNIKDNDYGMLVGFGAGYYLSSCLFKFNL